MRDEGSVSGIIKILAGIVLTLLLVAALFALWNRAKGGLDEAGNKMDQISSQLSTADYDALAGRTDVSGADISQFISGHNKDGVSIKVKTTKGTETDYSATADDYNDDYNAWTKAFAKTRNKKDNQYINPSAKFTCTLEYNTDETIKSISFKQN